MLLHPNYLRHLHLVVKILVLMSLAHHLWHLVGLTVHHLVYSCNLLRVVRLWRKLVDVGHVGALHFQDVTAVHELVHLSNWALSNLLWWNCSYHSTIVAWLLLREFVI